jgi:amidase
VDALDLAFAGVARQAELIREGEVSSRELVELYLERIERLDPELNSFRTVYAERAAAEAEQADSRRGAGDERPLLGVPIAVKDNLDVAGDVTGHGTVAQERPAENDAEQVRRLREAGCVLLGKTRLSELAIWPFTLSSMWGVTRNPWDPERTPGGSSGGSGAAVAAGLAGAATASDGGGSIRVPSAFCGLFGLKPQRGRVSLGPLPDHWYGLSAAGYVTRRVLDTAVLLDATAGPAPGDADTPPPPPRPFAEAAASEPGKLRVGLAVRPAMLSRVDGEVRDAVQSTTDLLRSLGHEVRDVSPPYGELTHIFIPLWLRGIRDDAHALDRPERMERRSRALARMGELISSSRAERAKEGARSRAAKIQALFEDCDVVLTPHPASLPLKLARVVNRSLARTWSEAANLVAFDVPWNVTGQPAASIPAGFTDAGLPLSVQLVGRPNDEGTLLSLAAQIESARPWADRRPPIS